MQRKINYISRRGRCDQHKFSTQSRKVVNYRRKCDPGASVSAASCNYRGNAVDRVRR